jgi:mannosyltransferase
MLNLSFIKSRIQIIVLILLITLGTLLRLYGLGIQSLWNDELSGWVRSNHASLTDVIEKGVKTDIHPPGHQIILYFVERYIGDSEAALRFPSAIAGIFSIPIIFLVSRRLYSYKEGLIAASFMAVLWCPVYYSQEARVYSFLLLFILLAVYFWIDIIQKLNTGERVQYKVTSTYTITAIITSYLHYYGLYFIVLLGLFAILLLFRRKQALVYLFIIHILILLAYIPWIPTMITQHFGVGASWATAPEISTFFSYIRFLFNKSNILLYLVLALYGFLFLINLYEFRRTGVNRTASLFVSPTLLLALWLIIPYAIVFFISITYKPLLTNRNLIISLPAGYLLLSRAITRLPINKIGHLIITSSLIVFFLYHLLFIMKYYSTPRKEQFREAVEFVVSVKYYHEDSIIMGYVWNPKYLNYYFEKSNSEQKVDIIAGEKEDISLASEYIQRKKPNYIWYISGHIEPSPEFIDFLNRNFTPVTHKPFIGTNVWLFENH